MLATAGPCSTKRAPSSPIKSLTDMGQGLAAESDASPTDIAAYYDAWAANDYDADVTSWGYEAPERVAAMVTRRLQEQPGQVLDAGCGTGRVGAALQALGVKDVIGGDFTPASVEAARRRNVYQSVDHLDLNERLVFNDNQFAAVVSVGVFSYLTDTLATITELLRITEPAGVVIFTQRTDLWAERECDALVSSLVATGVCTAKISDPSPYLPGHDEFGTDIGIIYITLTVKKP